MIHFQIAFPIKEDAEVIRQWRNDPLSLSMSFSYREPKTLETFFPEFVQKYFSMPALPPLFAIFNGKQVGLLRFDPSDSANFNKGCEISILIAPEWRNQGLGSQILTALDPFIKRQGIEGIVAQVMRQNSASLKIFTRSGYEIVEEGEVVRLEKRLLSKVKKPVFIIAEAGSNWYVEGDSNGLERGLKLIEAAKECGADAVKFQAFRAKEIYVPNPGSADYLNQDIGALFKELEISEEMIHLFAAHCKKIGIEFMSSVFSPADFSRIDPLVSRHKIASYEISYHPLIALAAKSKKPLILSTGASDVADIDSAVNVFRNEGGVDLTLMQCTAKYPAAPSTMNLRVIPWLKNRYQVGSGLSDHSFNPYEAALSAVALGATCIEKHFTLDRKLKGPDHGFAVEPHELKELVASIRAVEEMQGSSYKKVQESEQELYFFCRRGIQALRDIEPGEILKNGVNFAVLRPGKRSRGIHPRHLAEIEGKMANYKIPMGEGIQFTYLELQ